MLNVVVGLVGLSMGTFLIVFRKWYAARCVTKQNRLWGFRFGERTTELTSNLLVVIGLGFIIIGVLALSSL